MHPSRAISSTAGRQAHETDHYQNLGVKRSASRREIKDKFYELSKTYHPDAPSSSTNDSPEERLARFQSISASYATLSDDSLRRQYDASLSPAGHGRRARYTSGAAHHPMYRRSDTAPWSDGENDARRDRANYAWQHPSARRRNSTTEQAASQRSDPFGFRRSASAAAGNHFDAFAGREAWARERRGTDFGASSSSPDGRMFGSGTGAFGAKAEEESRLINDSSTKRTGQVVLMFVASLFDVSTAASAFSPTVPVVDIDLSNDLLNFFHSLNPAIEAAGHAPTGTNTPAFGEVLPEADPTDWSAPGSITATPVADASYTAITVPGSETDPLAPDEADQAISASIRKALDTSFYSTLPAPVRESVSSHLRNVTKSSELSKATTMALCMIYRAGMISDAQSKDRLLKMSQTWFDKASAEFWKGSVPFEAQILAAFDMWLFQVGRHGAAAGWAISFVLDAILLGCVNDDHVIDLGETCTPTKFMVACACLGEAFRLMLLGDRKPIYKFVNANTTAASKPDYLTLSDALQVTWGMPLQIALSILKIGELSHEQSVITSAEFATRAKAIEEEIQSFPGVVAHAYQSRQGAQMFAEGATHEMWRHAALIFLYQRLHGYGPLALPIKRALQRIITLGSTVHPAATDVRAGNAWYQMASNLTGSEIDPGGIDNERGVQWWLAATVAIDPNDREVCRKHLLRTKPQKLAESNVEAIELVWLQVDDKGWCVDWRQVLTQHARFVAFV
ncbi:hypothetical protein OIV83_004843 [Microbotryomycetes sp. JL201]|nr:hypothetical protein OIV83_004843 [Microbotryomycetes sp. JL201]